MSQKETSVNVGNKISIRTIQFLIAVLTLIISVLLLVATHKASAGYQELRSETDEYIRMHDSARMMTDASDYLTEQVRCFAETGDIEHLNNYFDEANNVKRRDKALEEIEAIAGRSKAFDALSQSMNESVVLMDREYYSMKLTAIAHGIDLSTLPPEVRDVKISDADAALSHAEMDEIARSMLYDDTYHYEKQKIMDNMKTCLDELEKDVDAKQKYTVENFGHILGVQRALIITAIVMILLAIVLTLLLLVGPLLHAVVYIRADEPIPIKGSKEFQFLAKTYNVMYEANKEQKEKLAYDATHDALTGLYNRSGYDFYMKNTNWDDSALIILDIDKFKSVNDTNGHEKGDEVLCKAAKSIKDSFRSQDYVCRLGGDEFAVILVHINEDSKSIIRNKVNAINKILHDTSDGLPESALSAGAAFGNGESSDEVFRRADAALYKVKSSGGGDCAFSG